MKRRDLPVIGLILTLGGAPTFADGSQAGAAPAAGKASNPFSSPSSLPFQAPPFDKIQDSDYTPAMEEGMRVQIAEMEAIANNPKPPTFANTIEAMERSGELLTRAAKVFFNLVQSNANDALQKIRAEEAPKLARHQTSIYLNSKLFARVQALYDKRASLKLDPQGSYLVERYERTFVRAGAQLPEADKVKLRAWNEEEAKLSVEFADKLLAERNASAVLVESKDELQGLSESDIAAAAEAAKERGLTGKWVLVLRNTTQQPALSSLANRALRERILRASETRGSHGGENDTRAIATRLAQLRADRAKLLGFPSAAAYILDDQMAKTPQNAEKLMTDLVAAATAKARGEAARMQKVIDAEKGDFRLTGADWEFYAEKVRKAEYDLEESEVKPYFDLDRVLRDGVFFAANKLYGITFKERKDLPVYHPDVRVWDVLDTDGKPLALYYGDYFARASKSGGAWEDSFVDPSELAKTKPVVVTVTNFTKPAAGQPALLSFDDVTTIFHEFGHALHGMFIHPRYPTLAGVPRDFVEFPSQINEHWALEPSVLANYAKHYRTGTPMPQDLVEKIKRVKTFNQGYATTEYLASALLDMAWHSLPPGEPQQQDAIAFERSALERFHIAVSDVPPRYHTAYFSHIWDGGYSAGYYAYLWSEVIDDDAYYWFKENGGMTRANGERFRRMVLSRAGTQDSAQLYRAFRGREPKVEPLIEERGLKPTAP